MPTGPDTTYEGYQEGDKVTFLGATGTVVHTRTDEFLMQPWPITVRFENGRIIYFTQDGHLEKEFTGAKLVVLERATKKVKKWRWIWKRLNQKDHFKVTGYMSEDDKKRAQNLMLPEEWHKIPTTEILEEEL